MAPLPPRALSLRHPGWLTGLGGAARPWVRLLEETEAAQGPKLWEGTPGILPRVPAQPALSWSPALGSFHLKPAPRFPAHFGAAPLNYPAGLGALT